MIGIEQGVTGEEGELQFGDDSIMLLPLRFNLNIERSRSPEQEKNRPRLEQLDSVMQWIFYKEGENK